MSIRRIALIAVVMLGALFVAFGAFAALAPIDFTVSVRGRVEPRRLLTVTLPHAGRIVSIAQPGVVRQGAPLVALDTSADEEECRVLEASLAVVTEEIRKEAPPIGDYRRRFEFERQRDEMQHKLAVQKRTMAEKRLLAPYDGTVLSVTGQVGAWVAADKALLVVGDERELVFIAEPSEAIRSKLRDDAPAQLHLDEYPYTTHGSVKARLAHIECRLDDAGTDKSIADAAKRMAPGHAGARYRLTLVPEAGAAIPLVTGLSGSAEIVVFHGTIMRYVLQNARDRR